MAAGEKFYCEPFLPEDEYRAVLLRGRIAERNLERALRSGLSPRANRLALGSLTRLEFRRRGLGRCAAGRRVKEAARIVS